MSDSFKTGYTQRTKVALRRSTSQVESIASSLIKKLEQLAKEREEEAEIAEKDGYDETIGTQSITWDEYCQYLFVIFDKREITLEGRLWKFSNTNCQSMHYPMKKRRINMVILVSWIATYDTRQTIKKCADFNVMLELASIDQFRDQNTTFDNLLQF